MDRENALDRLVADWRAAAWSRLRMELSGLALARKCGLSGEDYARHLWGEGAVRWMGKPDPTPAEYLAGEMAAFRRLYPGVRFAPDAMGPEQAQLTFLKGGCLGGWGKDQWGLAHALGLKKGHVCRYCRESFRLWGRQLGLYACTYPQADGTCIFLATTKPHESAPGHHLATSPAALTEP